MLKGPCKRSFEFPHTVRNDYVRDYYLSNFHNNDSKKRIMKLKSVIF